MGDLKWEWNGGEEWERDRKEVKSGRGMVEVVDEGHKMEG